MFWLWHDREPGPDLEHDTLVAGGGSIFTFQQLAMMATRFISGSPVTLLPPAQDQ